MQLASGSKVLSLEKVRVVGVLNVTPDSFVSESRVAVSEDIVPRALKLLGDGADILEIGGQSTGPESCDVSLEEELDRVIPAVRGMRDAFPDAWIAVDTFQAAVAQSALLAGADFINDVTAGRGDPAMLSVIAHSGCPCVLMYAKDPTPRTTKSDVRYDDVVGTIHAFLEERIAAATNAGIARSQIIVDPGLGHFVSSDPGYSFEILRRLAEFTDLGPVLVSPSRKSFLAGSRDLSVFDRLPATLAATTMAVLHGAGFLRTHDVKETRELVDGIAKIL